MAQNITRLADYRDPHNKPIIIGKEYQSKQPVTVTQQQLESGVYCLGVQGVGKSSLLESLIIQQIQQNESVIAIDPHGDMIREIIARMPQHRIRDMYLLDLKEARDWPFGMNLFALPKGQEQSRPARDAVRNQVMHAFERLWPEVKTGLYFGNVLRPVIATLIEKPDLTLAHVPRLFYNEAFRSHYTQGIENFEAREFWEEYEHWSRSKRERYVDPLLDRVKKLLADDLVRTILCQKGAKLDVGKAIAERKIFLLSLPLRDPAYEFSAPIIGTLFMTLVHGAIFSLGSKQRHERPACTLVIDEFQNFVTEDNEQFFSEGRKYRVKQILAHQGTHQLDKSGSTTMKKTATGAYTIICFRTNKDDAPEMAKLYTGIKKEPTNFYMNPLERKELQEHPNTLIKEFYWQYIHRLYQGAKLRETTERGSNEYGTYKKSVHPSYDFGFGQVTFEPDKVKQLLLRLNNLFYITQKDGSLQHRAIQNIREEYGRVVGAIATKLVDDPDIARELKKAQDEYNEAVRKNDQELEKIKRDMEIAINTMWEKFRPWNTQRSQLSVAYEENKKRYAFVVKEVQELRRYPPGKIIESIDDGERRKERASTVLARAEKEKEEYRKIYEKSKAAWEAFSLIPAPVDIREQEEKKHKLLKEQISRRYQAYYEKARPKIEQLKARLKKEVVVYNPKIITFNVLLEQVLTALIAQPITVDSPDISITEIADTLKGLPNYTAYVKVGSPIYHIETLDLNREYPAVPYTETDKRRNTIVKQTKEKYCRGRATIEKELAQVYNLNPQPNTETLKDSTPGKKSPPKEKTHVPVVKEEPQITEPNRPIAGILWRGEKMKTLEQEQQTQVEPVERLMTVFHPSTGDAVETDCEILEEAFRELRDGKVQETEEFWIKKIKQAQQKRIQRMAGSRPLHVCEFCLKIFEGAGIYCSDCAPYKAETEKKQKKPVENSQQQKSKGIAKLADDDIVY